MSGLTADHYFGVLGVFLSVSRVFQGIIGCSRGVPGLFRAVLGCSGGVPGMFRGVPGVFRGVPGCSGSVPGFTDTHTLLLFSYSVCRENVFSFTVSSARWSKAFNVSKSLFSHNCCRET